MGGRFPDNPPPQTPPPKGGGAFHRPCGKNAHIAFPVAALFVLLSACSLAPDYQVPSTPEPPAYKEAKDWAPARPADAVPRGAWWKVYKDPALDALEDKVTAANQNLKVALAQYEQAHQAAEAARASYFPLVTGTAEGTRNRLSATTANVPGKRTYNDFLLQGDVSYEIDLWGRVRNLVASAKAGAEASAADLAAVDLSLHAEMASDYFALRGDDSRQKILDETVKDYQQARDLTRTRYQGGVAPEGDLDQAESQYETARTQAEDLRMQRAQLEHAMAVLAGETPAGFTLAAKPVGAARRPPLHRACRQACWSGGRISLRPNGRYSPPTPISAWRGPPISRRSISAPRRAWKAPPLRA